MNRSSPEAVAAVDQAAKTRRSVRDFNADPVDIDEVTEILRLGAMAPSAWNLQPWRFLVVSDSATKQALQVASYNQRQVGQAPVVVVLYCDMADALTRVDESLHPAMPDAAKTALKGQIEAAFAAMTLDQRDAWGQAQGNILLGYLLLLLEVHGYGTSPMLGFDPPSVRTILRLPEHARIPAILAVGHSATGHPGPPHRLPFDAITRFVAAPGPNA